MAKTINMECPICKKKVLFVGVHDDEGNYHGLVGCEYENDPWSGLSYALHHEGWGDCPLCTDGAYSTMGGMLFDTAEEAISALSPPNEWVSVENALPPKNESVLCIVSGKPKPNITLEEAYQLGSWNKADGWIIDEYLDWEDADVSWWRKLPEPPDHRPPEGEV